mmetsp:Transcript_72491/g.193722  ORF Transcript_72491/g.193722 Transcript_72491/m.193722 type:complete len:285 (+) Transcript_72491:380-1234(+)
MMLPARDPGRDSRRDMLRTERVGPIARRHPRSAVPNGDTEDHQSLFRIRVYDLHVRGWLGSRHRGREEQLLRGCLGGHRLTRRPLPPRVARAGAAPLRRLQIRVVRRLPVVKLYRFRRRPRLRDRVRGRLPALRRHRPLGDRVPRPGPHHRRLPHAQAPHQLPGHGLRRAQRHDGVGPPGRLPHGPVLVHIPRHPQDGRLARRLLSRPRVRRAPALSRGRAAALPPARRRRPRRHGAARGEPPHRRVARLPHRLPPDPRRLPPRPLLPPLPRRPGPRAQHPRQA